MDRFLGRNFVGRWTNSLGNDYHGTVVVYGDARKTKLRNGGMKIVRAVFLQHTYQPLKRNFLKVDRRLQEGLEG